MGPEEFLASLVIETEYEGATDKYIAAIAALPGCMVYGETREKAIVAVRALARRVVAERIENGEDFRDGSAQPEADRPDD